MNKHKTKQPRYVSISIIIFIAIIVGSWMYLIINNDDLFDVFNQRNMEFLKAFVENMFGKGAKYVAYTDEQR